MNKKYTFKYPLFFRLLYRYGNIPISIILILYIISIEHSKIGTFGKYFYSLGFFILLIILNAYYYKLYKLLPYKIEIDGEKIIFSDFIFSKNIIELPFSEIDKLEGGIFEGKITGLMKIYNTAKNIEVGFFRNLKLISQQKQEQQKLEVIVLSKVKKEIYDSIVSKLLERKSKKSK